MLKLEQGRPADTSGRQEKEIRVYDFLDKLGVIYDRVDHEALMTMEACEEADRVLAAGWRRARCNPDRPDRR